MEKPGEVSEFMHTRCQDPQPSSTLFPFGSLDAGSEAFRQQIRESFSVESGPREMTSRYCHWKCPKQMAQSNLQGSMTPAQARK